MPQRRVAALALAAFGLLLLQPATVDAHALLASSDPAAGSEVATPPSFITLTFTEAPDPKLSAVEVLDTAGDNHATSGMQPTANPDTVHVALGPISAGVYTVAWRTVSAVDGHVVGGSFSFGVGTPAAAVAGQPASSAPPAPGASPGVVVAHWFLYLGLVALLGIAFAALVVARESVPVTTRALELAWLITGIATFLLIAAQASDAGVGLSGLPGTSLGTDAVLRFAPLLVLGALAAVAARRPGRAVFAFAGICGAAATLVDAALSHAAADPLGLANVLIQWLHLAAVGVWMGGLAALLLQVRGAGSEEKGRAVRRFATWATLGLAVVSATGVVRALVEVGTIDALARTDYGHLVIAKTVLLAAVAGLGAVNHFRNVPRADLRGLRLAGSGELALGIVLLLLASALVNLEPPARALAAAGGPATPIVTVNGSDYGTTVRLELDLSPGMAGFNRFVVHVVDYDTRVPIPAERVVLTFSPTGRADVGQSDLTLTGSGGTYAASGANLSLAGPWQISALVANGSASVTVQLQVTVAAPPQRIDVSRVAGGPTLYTVHLPGGQSAQLYLDPGKRGPNDLHVTFFDAAGNELAANDIAASASAAGAPPAPIALRTLAPGHVVGSLTMGSASESFEVTATAPDGSPLRASVVIAPTP